MSQDRERLLGMVGTASTSFGWHHFVYSYAILASPNVVPLFDNTFPASLFRLCPSDLAIPTNQLAECRAGPNI
jgi:hypothetical protein